MRSLRKIFFRFFANRYLAIRGQVPADELKQRTLEAIRRFQEKAQNLTQEQLNARLDQKEWSAAEVIYHAVHSVQSIFRKCEELRNEKDVPPMERDAMGRTKSVSREDLIELCNYVYGISQQMNYTASSKKKAVHAVLGPGDFKRWLVINMVHLERHYKQLLRTASLQGL